MMKRENGYAPRKRSADENGKIRNGCTVIPKGGVYEQHLFTVKDDRFKSEQFLDEVKRNYTDLINRHISDPEQRLKVFDPEQYLSADQENRQEQSQSRRD